MPASIVPSAAFVTLGGLSAATPDGRPLFQDLTLAFGAERTGLVGRNGAGKTTLLRLVLGEAQPVAGRVVVRGRIGVLRQTPSREASSTLAGLLGVEAGLARLARNEAGQGEDADLDEADWTLPSRLETALDEVGLAGLDLDRPLASLSGGQRRAGGLAAAQAGERAGEVPGGQGGVGQGG